ncbi:transposable element Tc3 transposase [Trichonephila clavipes]|nr:transposable element Tc3 transposase [Trichonephila clavipes]
MRNPSTFICPDNLVALHFKYDQARRRFVEWAQNEIAVVPDFHKRILFSDEAHFWLNGYVNKQNCRISSEANPQVYVETPLYPEKLTVWCALWAGGITGPYFFENDEGHNVTVNGDRYRAMITNFFIPELNNHDVQELWFQQDGPTRHRARATIDLLKDTFGDRLISRFGPVNWPPRSCDLTPLDYFLWGYVKSLVYADKPQTLDHLEDNIRRFIAYIRPQMLENVIENWTSRLDYIRASRGSPMPEIIFKICQVIYSQFGLAIHQNDHQAGRRFVEWAQNEIAVVPDFHKRILFSDEAHFWLNGYVNKQNCRIWSEANLQVDESRFNLSSDDIRVRVWKIRGECFNRAFALKGHTPLTAGVMIWSAIAYTVTPNIHPWHIDSPPVCPGHPSATCIATHGNTPRKPFSTRQCCTQQGCHNTTSSALLPFPVYWIPRFVTNQTYMR